MQAGRFFKYRVYSTLLLLAVLSTFFSCGSSEKKEPSQSEKDADISDAGIITEGTIVSNSLLPSIINDKDLLLYSDFSVNGEIRSLRDSSSIDGYGTSMGFYRFIPREDGSSNLCYIDYALQEEIYLCAQPNCEHNNSNCTSWYPSNLGVLLPIPVGDKIVVLHGGSPSYADSLGESALAQIELINADGTQRETVKSFPASVTISTFPRGGFAYDNESVYFVLTHTSADGVLRTLCAVNSVSKECFALFDLEEEEERIVGGYKSMIVLSYTPNSYNLYIDAKDLVTHTIRIDLSTGYLVPFCSYPYSSISGVEQGRYWILEPSGALSSYDLITGENSSTETIQWPESFNPQSMHFDGFVDHKLMAHSFVTSATDSPSILVYCAVDVQTGNVSTLDWTHKKYDSYYVDVIVSELDNKFLFAYDQEEIVVTLPDGMQMSYPCYRYALIDKNDFWNNNSKYDVIRWTETDT